MGEPVGGADDEGVEEVLRVQPGVRLTGSRRGRGLGAHRTGDRTAGAPGARARTAGAVLLVVRVALLLVPLALGRLRPVVVLRLLRAAGAVGLAPLLGGLVAVAVRGLLAVRLGLAVAVGRGLLAIPVPPVLRLLPGEVLLGTRPGARLGALLLVVGVGRAGRRHPVVGGPVAVTVVRVVVRVLALLPRVAVALLALVHRGCRRGGRFTGGVVDGDRDPDGATALAGQRLADERREAALQHALAPFVGDGQQCGVGDEGQRLAALDPLLVLRLDALLALPEELFQHSWPHCGKIGRYVSHKARSLACPTNVWFSGRDGSGWVRPGSREGKESGVQPR